MASGVLTNLEGFDLVGDAGNIFTRAFEWFAAQGNIATSGSQRRDFIVGAVRSLNNVTVCCITRYDEPSARLNSRTPPGRAGSG